MTAAQVSPKYRLRKVLLVSVITAVAVSSVLAVCVCLFLKFSSIDVHADSQNFPIQDETTAAVQSTDNVTSVGANTHNESQSRVSHQEEFVKPVRRKRKLENSEQTDIEDRELDIWHPWEYEFQAFGRQFRIVLSQDHLMYSDIQVTRVSKNASSQQQLGVNPDCYYSGYLKDEPESRVTVNLCNGMKGHIRSRIAGTYSIQPVSDTFNESSTSLDHILRRIDPQAETSSEDTATAEKVVRYPTPLSPDPSTDYSPARNTSYDVSRRKRSADEYTIELMVVVDKKVTEIHGPLLDDYIILLLKEVQEIFKDNSIGNRINLVPVKIVKLDDEGMFRDRSQPNRETVMLNLFCDWQYKNNDHDDDNPNHHDSALLITKDTICSFDRVDRTECGSFLGLAQIGGVCNNQGFRSCAAVKDSGINTVFTLAHELGHILNMPHDEDVPCNIFRGDDETKKIMSKSATKDTDQWTWSECSRHYLTEYLEQENVSCLHDSPLKRHDNFNNFNAFDLPGSIYTLDEQCEKAHGSKAWTHCKVDHNVCDLLWCQNIQEKLSCRLQAAQLWADGTPCGHNRWCRRKKCVPISNHPVVHGGWGEWQPYTSCSRSCGGGISNSHRLCDSPKNENGGDYCKGIRVRYKSCNTHECPSDTPDFRSQQCAKYNNSTTQWVPFARSLEHERCRLVCKEIHDEALFQTSEKVIDGTRCDTDTTYGVCVNGKCMNTGCDHRLDSNLLVDSCGVCGGNNSTCKLVRKEFSREAIVGYTFIDTIPAGASNIDIQQLSFNESIDINYLALKDAETKIYILNGYHSVSPYPKSVFFGDFKLNYGGSLQTPERITSSHSRSLSRLHKDLILEIFSSSNAPPFKVICEYMFPVAVVDSFRWEVTNEWTKCNNVCYGEEELIIRCVRKDTGSTVYSESCAGLPKPQSETRVCNEHCLLKWKVIDRTECSSHCGPGRRKLTYRCYPESQDDAYSHVSGLQYLPDIQCSHIEKPSDIENCMGPCDRVHWRYSEWGPCSVSCGRGLQRRHAVCVDESNRPLDESVCASIEKKTENVCLMEDCPDWLSEPWSQCSVSCGNGEQKRRVWCVQNNRIVSQDACLPQKKPAHIKSCEMPSCPRWITGEWSKCSVTCGTGTVVRSVHCNAPDARSCPSYLRPAETENCSLYPCQENNDIMNGDQIYPDKYQWRTGAWSNCSAECGKGMKQRTVKCYNNKMKSITTDEYCSIHNQPPATELCQERNCPQWKTSAWSSCSVTCGRGSSLRNVWCEIGGKWVGDSECLETQPPSSKSCETTPCLAVPETSSEMLSPSVSSSWRFGWWGECSVSCGSGMKIRNVVCTDDRGSIVTNCIDHLRPSSSSPCNTHPCPDQVKWKYGDWSQCNQTCGEGYQRRQAQCISNEGENVADTYCSQIEKPVLVRQCENSPCWKIIYQWKSSAWSECSVSCGSGIYTRSVQCYKIDEYNIQNTEIVHDSYCTAARPVSQKECQKEACYVYTWKAGPWSECSVSCGTGMQKRDMDCIKVSSHNYSDEGKTVAETFCEKTSRPSHHQECHFSACVKEYIWVPGPWGECNGPCGHKKKRRKLYCYYDGKNVHRSNCTHVARPKRRRKCVQQKCDPASCLDIKMKYRAEVDQEYVISILGRNISIYCHKMESSQPKEYLSLAVGTLENFSEYNSRLRDLYPGSCPNKTRISLGTEFNYGSYGRTEFRKLRLNVTSMQILMDDYTFASTSGYYPTPIGQAGDCYGSPHCRGTFSINVSGTGLRIAPSVQWEKVGSYAAIDVKFFHERRKVVGRCGGYCSMCRPAHGLKLDVLPP